jgi:hypothetical protein
LGAVLSGIRIAGENRPPLRGGKRSSGAFLGSNAFAGWVRPNARQERPLGPASRRECAVGPHPIARQRFACKPRDGTSPREGALRRLPAELRWEGLKDKAPRTSVGAPSRGRARACVCVEDGAKRMRRAGRPKKRRATDWQNPLDSNATE